MESTFDCSTSVPSETESDGVLFRRYARYVAFIGFRLLRSESDVDDLVQQVFMTAFKQREQLRDYGAARSWLATITVRTAQRQLRRRKLRQFVGLDERPVILEMLDPGLSPERSALLSRVYEILDTLPVHQRVAWTLRYVEGEKLAQVAERCDCSLASAKRRITAAHTRLLAALEVE
jgi:RNA polymerase sigma-70 factor (ECF subfamily)